VLALSPGPLGSSVAGCSAGEARPRRGVALRRPERQLAAERQARKNLAAELAAERARRAELESQLGG
jgi:hypothetical protein